MPPAMYSMTSAGWRPPTRMRPWVMTTFAWRSAGKVRAFVRLAAVQAEVFVDPVAPRARRAAREGKIGQGAGGAARTQKLRL